MTDRYKPLRDAIAARSWPVGDSFPRNMGLVEELLKERDALRAAVKRVVEIADSDPFQTVGFTVEHAVDLRAALADGEEA